MWHSLAMAEAHLVRLTLARLRIRLPLFSHGIVHDALYIDDCIPQAVFCSEFNACAASVGLPLAKMPAQSWDEARNKCRLRLEASHYHASWKPVWLTGLNREGASHEMGDEPGDNLLYLWDTHNTRPKQTR